MGGILDRIRHPRARFVKSLPKSAYVLDLGCGDGTAMLELKMLRQDIKFIGVDLAPGYEGKLVISDLEKSLPFKNDTFDACFMSHVIEHLRSIEVIADEIRRTLKPKSSIYVEAPSVFSIFLPSLPGDNLGNFFDHPNHIRPWTKRSLKWFLKLCGFDDVEVGSVRHWPDLRFFPWFILKGLLPSKWGYWTRILRFALGGLVYGIGSRQTRSEVQ